MIGDGHLHAKTQAAVCNIHNTVLCYVNVY